MHKKSSKRRIEILLLSSLLLLAACNVDVDSGSSSGGSTVIGGGETAQVTDIIDGDTIDVDINGVGYRVRYIGVNTPERDETCYADATNANADLVDGQTVTLVRDSSNTDRYGRLLRYVYVGNVFVNAQLVAGGLGGERRIPAGYRQRRNLSSARSCGDAQQPRLSPHGNFCDDAVTAPRLEGVKAVRAGIGLRRDAIYRVRHQNRRKYRESKTPGPAPTNSAAGSPPRIRAGTDTLPQMESKTPGRTTRG